jgi:hypothetical protein
MFIPGAFNLDNGGMKLFGFFSSRKSRKTPARAGPAVSTKPVRQVRFASKDPHPLFDDTGELEISEEDRESDDPYATASWELDRDQGLRRIDDDKVMKPKKKPKSNPNDPYNTGAFTKNW